MRYEEPSDCRLPSQESDNRRATEGVSGQVQRVLENVVEDVEDELQRIHHSCTDEHQHDTADDHHPVARFIRDSGYGKDHSEHQQDESHYFDPHRNSCFQEVEQQVNYSKYRLYCQ